MYSVSVCLLSTGAETSWVLSPLYAVSCCIQGLKQSWAMEGGMDLMVFAPLLQYVNEKLWIAFIWGRDIANYEFLEALRIKLSKSMSLHMIDKGLCCWATTLTQVKYFELKPFWVKSGPEFTDGHSVRGRMGGDSNKKPLWGGEDFGVMQKQTVTGTKRGGRSRKAAPLGPSERRQPCPHAECKFWVVLGSRVMGQQVFVVFQSPSL